MAQIHQYPSTETFPSAVTYPGQWPDPSTILPFRHFHRKTGQHLVFRPNAT